MENSQDQSRNTSPLHKVLHTITSFREAGILLSLILIVIVIMSCGQDARQAFCSQTNLRNLFRQIALLAVYAIGETFVIVAGGIDLSVGSLVAFAGVLSAIFLSQFHMSVATAVLLVLAASTFIGIFHAGLISTIGLQPFIVTLGTMQVLRGVSLLITDSIPIPIAQESFIWLGNGRPWNIPTPFLILLAVVIISVVILHRTIHGQYMYALGSNEEATRLSGVNVTRVKYITYGLGSLLMGLAGIVFAAYTRQGNPNSGMAYELNAIAAAVIGGCSLTGGQGSILGTLLGAAILSVILNGLNLVIEKNASLWQGVIVGSVVIAAVAVNVIRQRRTSS